MGRYVGTEEETEISIERDENYETGNSREMLMYIRKTKERGFQKSGQK